MGTELERLRHRLYRPAASEADVEGYRRALAEEPEPPEPPAAGRAPVTSSRRRRMLAVGVLIAGVAALAVPAAVLGPGAAPVPRAATTVPVRPPIGALVTGAGLSAAVPVQRSIDALFAEGRGDRAAAADLLDARIRRAVLSAASERTIRAAADGRSDAGGAVLEPPSGEVVIAAGDVVLLSAVLREPASATWEVRGWRQGEPHRPHPVVVTTQPGGADRLAVAVLRVPETLTVTAVSIRVAPRTPLRFRVEHHGPSVCPASDAPTCVSPAGS